MLPLENVNLTIDSIYNILLKKLTQDHKIKDISSKLSQLLQFDEKVLYVYNLIKSYSLLPLIIKVDKSDFVSTHYRNLGNEYYEKRKLYKAWQYYNLSLCYAPLTSENYGLAVANRTAVFATLKKYKECLEDIRKVFTFPYPNRIRDKLMKRKELCETALGKQKEIESHKNNKEIDDIITFKGTKHHRYASSSSKLTVNYSNEMGRHVVANEDIQVGEIIVQEEPFVKLLLKSQFFLACNYCLSRLLNQFPCPHCCFTMYCSRVCMEKAWEDYHNYECSLTPFLLKMDFTKLELLALRTVIKGRKVNNSWPEFIKSISDAESTINTDDWGHVNVNGELVYDSKCYSSIHTLATNASKRDMSDMFQKCVSAAVLLYALAVVGFLKTDDSDLKDAVKRCTASALLTHVMTAPTNMHGISTNVENDEGNYVDEYNIGCAAYAYLSLMNHSCSPNVVRFSKLGTAELTLIALRPIKKGMQIMDNYGAHHAVHTKAERQNILKSQYKFNCLCEACVGDWPLYHNLAVIPNLPLKIIKRMVAALNEDKIEALQKADKEQSLKIFQTLCELITALEPYAPCKPASDCQEALKQCLAIFAGVLRNGYTEIAEWSIPGPQPEGSTVPSVYMAVETQDLI